MGPTTVVEQERVRTESDSRRINVSAVLVCGFKCERTRHSSEYSMSTRRGGIKRSAAEWYANTLSVLLLAGGAVLLFVVFGVGPTALVVSFGISLAIVFTVLFLSLFFESDAAYRVLSRD